MVHSTTNKMTWTRVVMLLTLLFGTIVSTFSVQSVAAAELTPVISNLQQETVANTYRISFDYNLSGLAAKSGDTFTIDLPAELETANLIPFDVTQNGVVIGQAVPSGDKVTVTFNDAVTGDTNGSGSMAFNVIFKTQPTEGETITAEVTVGTESIVIKKTGTGPIPFETLVNKYNQTGSHVTKDFKLNGNWGPWMNTGKDYLSWWHISINGDATKADLSQLVIRDQMNGTVVTDFSGFTNGAGQTIDYASLFNGSYLKQSFSLVRNGQVVANSSQIMDVIEWSDNGFTLDLTKVDASFATPSQDQIVLSYMTLIPFGTAEITNVASFTSAEYPEVKTDTAYWKNATGEAIYDASSTTTEEPSTSTTTEEPSTSTTTEEPSASTTTTEELSTSSTTESNMAGGVTPLSGTQKKVLPSTGERTSATVILVGISSFVFGLYSFRKNNIK